MTLFPPAQRVLVAGIGNIFLGDDAFGVEVAQRLLQRPHPQDVRVVDFGIRGLDLVYALLDGYEVVILIDIVARGDGPPGTLYLLEPEVEDSVDASPLIEAHSMDPMKVLRTAAAMGAKTRKVFIVGCEPTPVANYDDGQTLMELSEPVRAAVDEAVILVESLVEQDSGRTPAELQEPSRRELHT